MGFFNRKTLTEQEDLYIQIIQKMAEREDSIIEINPQDMSYLISLEKEQYYISIDSVGINFSNHIFLIMRHFDDYVLDKAKEILKLETTTRRERRKTDIFQNENKLLTKIKDNL